MQEFRELKRKIISINSGRWWGDDFDVRFHLLSKLMNIKNKTILDIGGGFGIISSELDNSNFCINLDISLKDLNQCNKVFDRSINGLNSSMLEVALKNDSIDYVICANLLEVAKTIDIENNLVIEKEDNKIYPTIIKVLEEIHRVLKPNGKLFLTTPNNEYYQSTKLTYEELKYHLKENFEKNLLVFFNTYPRLKSQNRKLNMANVIPKILSKVSKREKIIEKLIHKDKGTRRYSVSFYVEGKK